MLLPSHPRFRAADTVAALQSWTTGGETFEQTTTRISSRQMTLPQSQPGDTQHPHLQSQHKSPRPFSPSSRGISFTPLPSAIKTASNMDFKMQSESMAQHSNGGPEQNMMQQDSNEAASQASSNTSTSYPSPTNPSNNDQHMSQASHPAPSFSYAPTSLSLQSSVSQSHLHAPLPSPSSGNTNPFFGRSISQPTSFQPSHPHSQSQHYHAQQQQQRQQMPSGHLQHNGAYPVQHDTFSQNNGPMNQPGALPADFLAEAAKRAQMACLMRDLGDVAL